MRRLVLAFILTSGMAATPLATQTAGTPVPAPVVTQPAEYAQTFHLTHARAQEVQQLLLTLMNQASPGTRPSITMSRDTNSLSVRATEPVMKVVESIIRANDVPQTPPTVRTPNAAPAPQGGRGQATPPAVPAPAAPQRPPSLTGPSLTAVNVRLDITITDTFGGKPQIKTVTMTIMSGQTGMIRTQNTLGQRYAVRLNVDAMATAYSSGLISTRLTVNYLPGPEGDPSTDSTRRDTPGQLEESIAVVLTDGKPLVLTESADPVTDRRVTLSATATILK